MTDLRPLPGAAGRSLARAGSVAQSDLGLRPEPGRHQLEQGGAGGWPVTVKSLQLQDRQDRRANLVKIRSVLELLKVYICSNMQINFPDIPALVPPADQNSGTK